MTTVYIGLGSNKGNKRRNLIVASALLAERAGDISALSGFYETAPYGFVSDEFFLNAALQLETDLSPQELLRLTQEIEKELGRTQKSQNQQYEDRTIDIDLLFYGDLVLNTEELVLPHPQLHERLFVLEPLSEIAPDLVHPLKGETIRTLYRHLIQAD